MAPAEEVQHQMNRADTVKVLELVGRSLAKDDMVPVYQCFMFDTASVRTYSGSIGIVMPLLTDVAFAVRGVTLLGLLQNSHSADCEFKKAGDDIVIKAGKSVFKLPYFPESEFKFEEPPEMGKQSIELTDDLLSGLEACLLTVSNDATQGKFQGVCINQQGKFITLYSCNGDALTRYVTKIKSVKGPDRTMPVEFCEHLLRIFKETEANGGKLQINEDWARAYISTGYRIFGRLLEITEPFDYAGELAATLKTPPNFVALPEGLDRALSRARVVADPESARTVLALDGKQLTLVTTTHAGIVKDVLPMEHAPVAANVSAELIQRSTTLANEMAVFEDCTVFRHGDRLLQVLGNMGT